jgi:hypothetical protein
VCSVRAEDCRGGRTGGGAEMTPVVCRGGKDTGDCRGGSDTGDAVTGLGAPPIADRVGGFGRLSVLSPVVSVRYGTAGLATSTSCSDWRGAGAGTRAPNPPVAAAGLLTAAGLL